MSYRAILVVGVAILACALLAGSALAAKGGNGHGRFSSESTVSSITLNEPDPHFGGTVSFTLAYPSMNETPMVRVICSQNGEMVYQYAQWSDGSSPWIPMFVLWSATWAANGGGPADCIADLYYYTWQGQTQTGIVYLAHTEFTAVG